MDSEAKDEIIKHINPQRGVKSELDRVLSNNESLREADSWQGTTEPQAQAIRQRMAVTSPDKGLKFDRNGRTYIRVSEDNFKRVTSKDDVYVDEESDRVWLRDSEGKFKELIK